ncbi:hypothetical protein [Nannocystis pusilla]|uniref:hypothetical protein n=1 Tax=Nannocystis pusilla TaxID=889268 RepID=UPI003BF41FCA
MRVVRLLRTPWCPYSLMFAADGERIAVGGGAWYGGGGILLARLGSDETALHPAEARFTVSGVCFSGDDRHLAASTWSSSHHHGPTHLWEVNDLSLRPAATLVHAYSDPIGDPCPTGVLLTGERVIVRNDTSIAADVFALWPPPPELRIAGPQGHPRAHSGIAGVADRVFTGGGGSLALGGWRRDLGRYEAGKAADGLVSAPLAGDGPLEFIPAPSRRITAIATRPGSEGFVTGGLDGEVHRWTRAGAWRSELLLRRGGDPHDRASELAWATYTPHSVVAICALADGERWVSVTAGGELRLWRGDDSLGAWFLPERGSPRALAAHPARPVVAVGIKQQHHADRRAATVLLVDLA